MIAVCYTGDIRGNQEIAKANHKKLFDKLSALAKINIYWFTKNTSARGECPYEENIPDDRYRRGQGGAIQVWDFVNAIYSVNETYVIRMRTDTWFTDSAIEIIFNETREVLEGRTDVAFFGSDLINNNQGTDYKKIFVDINGVARIQDFIVVANKNKLRSKQDIYDTIEATKPKKRRSGNKLFRYIIVNGSNAYTILCHIFLIRKNYPSTPNDMEVFKDYLDSYSDPKFDELLKPAYDWLHKQTNT